MSTKEPRNIDIVKIGSIVRVNLPKYDGKLAIGRVDSVQLVYVGDEPPYLVVWVEMLIDCITRPFEMSQLKLIKRNNYEGLEAFYNLTDAMLKVAA